MNTKRLGAPAALLALSLRYFLRHRAQAILAVIGIALGVAVVLAIDLASASAQRSFAQATEDVVGRATHQIVGGPASMKWPTRTCVSFTACVMWHRSWKRK